MASMAADSDPMAAGGQTAGSSQGGAARVAQGAPAGTPPAAGAGPRGEGYVPDPQGSGAVGSPVMKRARMEAWVMPTVGQFVVQESFTQQGLHRDMATLKTQVHALGEYVVKLADKHNVLMDETAKSLEVRKARIYGLEAAMNEVKGRINASENYLTGAEQRIRDCENRIGDGGLQGRMQRLEDNVIQVVSDHVQAKLEAGLAETITEMVRQTAGAMQQQVIEAVEARASDAIASLRIQNEGVKIHMEKMQAEAAAHGIALDTMQKDGQQLAEVVKAMNLGHGPGGADPWGGYKASTTASAPKMATAPQVFTMNSPEGFSGFNLGGGQGAPAAPKVVGSNPFEGGGGQQRQ